jgi:2-dehydropantoate 2-reductase
MRIAVIGAGEVGGGFGTAPAKGGSDVTFLACGALDAAGLIGRSAKRRVEVAPRGSIP